MKLDSFAYLAERYPLLISKLYIPQLDNDLLCRPHLAERLNQAVARPVVTVTAPAGWGKTTLLASWANQARQPVAWLSLDEGDNELARFWLHLIAALQQICPGVGESALIWFYAREAPPVEARLTLLINDLALTDETFVLAIDDYHCIHSDTIHSSLTYFVEHLPPNVHLILTSRSELPLPQARWRARRRLVEFDSQDLRFSTEECAEFLQKVMGLPLTPAQVAVLIERTEGWVAGLQLIALAMPDRANTDTVVAGLAARNRYIFDYLSEEVLARQPSVIQQFLLKTSVLERLSSELCATVSGVGDSQGYLEMLEQGKLFIVALDGERHWFRYHHLFRDFLLNHLARTQPDQVAELHRRAAQAYAANGLPHDAVPHALVAKDYELAGRITMQYANELWRREEFATLRSWLEALPLELRTNHPDLCLFLAWSLLATLGLNEMLFLVVRAEALLDAGALPLGSFSPGHLRGILAVLQSAVSVLQQDLDAASEFARSALGQLSPDQKEWRYAALVGAGLAHHYRNDTDAAVQDFAQAFEEAAALKHGAGSFYGTTLASSWLARLYVVQGSLQRAKEIYQEALSLATGQTGKPYSTGTWAFTGLGELYYQWNDLDLAEKYYSDSLALSSQITPSTAPPYIPLARLSRARGDLRSAKAFLVQAARLVERGSPSYYAEQVELYRAWLAIQEDDRAVLNRWLLEQDLDLAQPTPRRETTYVMAARILIAMRDYRAALVLIEKLLAIAEAGARGGVVIELLSIQALAFQGQDKLDLGLTVLQRAITRAHKEKYVRLFVDEGEPMHRLLRLLVARSGATEYLSRLLSAFATKHESPDALNERELEILRLLATGMSNQEIAQVLIITVGTVKWHTHHIYSKLGVKSRGQAVAKARDLKWLFD